MRFPVIACLLIMVYCSGCSRYYYKPNGVNAPLLTAKGQLHATGDIEKGGDGPLIDVQGAWSPLNHLGILADASTFHHSESSPDAANGRVAASATLVEAGAGYYFAQDYYTTGSKKLTLVIDCYGGAGKGSIKSDINADISRLFVQPGIGIRTKFLDVSFNMRLTDLHYYNFNANGHDDNYLQQQNLITGSGRRIDQGSYIFTEPSVTFRGGYKFIKFQVQFVGANSQSNVPWQYSNSHTCFGLMFKFEELKGLFRKKPHAPEEK